MIRVSGFESMTSSSWFELVVSSQWFRASGFEFMVRVGRFELMVFEFVTGNLHPSYSRFSLVLSVIVNSYLKNPLQFI